MVGHLDGGAGCSVEDEGDRRLAGAIDGSDEWEAAEVPRVEGACAHVVKRGRLLTEYLLQVLARVGAFDVAAAVDRHGEGLAAGVLSPGNRDVDVAGEAGQALDVVLVARDGVLERVLVAVVCPLGSLEAGEFGVADRKS